jgi:hypothetical protein
MTAHGEPTTEVAASAGVRSPPWGYRYLPCRGAAIPLSLSAHPSLFTLTTHCTLPTTHRPLLCLTSPLTSHALDSSQARKAATFAGETKACRAHPAARGV